MKKNVTLLFIALFVCSGLIAQDWIQTSTTPEGGGITEIVVRPDNNHIFVTTASFNWPSGDDGGIRRSSDDGATWDNLMDAYTGRTITFGADGNLYASVWPYPSDEGLYRSTDNGDSWNQLVTVPEGNNIFSITVNITTTENTIFAGTRQGVYRSLDNGVNWAYASTGIPVDTWVRDIEVDSSGIIVAATSNGLFSSEDNGDTWLEATGAGIEDNTVTKLAFDYSTDLKDGNTGLLAVSSDGSLHRSFADSKYLLCTIMAIFSDGEGSSIWTFALRSLNKKMHGVSTFPTNKDASGFRYTYDDGENWELNNSGLPGSNPLTSAMSGISTDTEINLKIGLFENMNGGAKVFKLSIPWSSIDVEELPIDNSSDLYLKQNYPNPFSDFTEIVFNLSEAGHTSLKVYSVDGRLIETLVNTQKPKGECHIIWKPESLDSGIYFYILNSGNTHITKKMLVLK